MDKGRYYTLGSVTKAFRVIELLVSRKEYDLKELSEHSGMLKTTVHRILLTLQDLGYVEKNPDSRRYRAAIKFFELGQSVIRHTGLLDAAKPHMITLSKKAGESVNLGILDGIDAVCIDRVEGKNPLKVDQPIGSRYPAYVSAFGKAMLAFLPGSVKNAHLSGHKLIRMTPKSLRSHGGLEENLEKIRKRGFALDDEEAIKGIRCIGAPIFGPSNRIVAGISIAAPAFRLEENEIPGLSRLVMQAASCISRDLGGSFAAD